MSQIKGFLDRGAAKHFHGRTDILREFKKRLKIFKKSKGGTILLVQGPPGVGKTALLAKCWDEAEERRWKVVEIDPEDLWNPDSLRKTLGLRAQKRVVSGGGEAGWRKWFTLKRKRGIEIDNHPRTPLDLLKLKKKPLLLILDEAQHLGEDSRITGEYKDDVRDLLDRIHNSGLGRPVILLAGGLGMTSRAFNNLGISRSSLRSITNLDPLDDEEERTVIREWLKKEGKAQGDTTDWVDAIAKETYRWPQHIIAYTVPAADHLEETGGKMTMEGLMSVLEQGRENRRQYYVGRMVEFLSEERTSFAQIIGSVPKDRPLKKTEILAHLAEEYGEEKARELFFLSVQKGVFYYSAEMGDYSVPIPSMRDWLLENYLPKEISEQQPDPRDQSETEQLPEADPEKEGAQKEPENHKTDRPSPEKEEGTEPTTPQSGKGNPDQDTPQSRDTSGKEQDTDMGMER